MSLLLLIVLLVLVFGGLPTWGYHQYGYAPSGIGTIVLMIVLILLLTGRVQLLRLTLSSKLNRNDRR